MDFPDDDLDARLDAELGKGAIDIDAEEMPSGSKSKSAVTNPGNYLPNAVADDTLLPIYITKTGAFISFEHLGDDLKLIRKIENYFTLTTKLITGKFKRMKSCSVDKKKKRIIVPRFGVYEILTDKYGLAKYPIKSQIKPGERPGSKYLWKGTQTPNQERISNKILSEYYTKERIACGSAGVILNLEAGQGKSYLAAYMIYKLQRKTAIILHSTSLIEQWVKVLENALGTDISIGYYYAKKKKLGDIMLMIIDSATSDVFKFKDKHTDLEMKALDFYNQFGFVIYDECHTYANRYSMKAMKMAHAPCMLGLSATPDENSMGFDPIVWWELGPTLDAKTIDGFESTADDFKAEVHRIMYYGPPSYTKVLLTESGDTSMTNVAGTINMLSEDPTRKSIVIDCIKRGLDLGLYMFVFADRREYLTELQTLLSDTLHIEGEIVDNEQDFVRVVGGAKPAEMEQAEATSRVIFTTYQYMGTGKSIIKMNGLVLAHPRKSKMAQYIARILRLGSDTTITRHIWDICDMKLKISNQWNTRKLYYQDKGFTIDSEKIKYEDYEGVKIEEPNIGEEETDEKEIALPNKLDKDKVTNIVSGIMNKLRGMKLESKTDATTKPDAKLEVKEDKEDKPIEKETKPEVKNNKPGIKLKTKTVKTTKTAKTSAIKTANKTVKTTKTKPATKTVKTTKTPATKTTNKTVKSTKET